MRSWAHQSVQRTCGLALLAWLTLAGPARADLSDALMQAAAAGDGPRCEKLLRAGADPNVPGPQGATALLVAARAGHEDAVRVLMAFGASVTQPDGAGATPLAVARASGHAFIEGMLERQTGFAYGVAKINAQPGAYPLGGGTLTLVAKPTGELVYSFLKYGMAFDEAVMVARVLGGPGLNYGKRRYVPGGVLFEPAAGVGPQRVTAWIQMSGPWPVEVKVTLR